MKRTIIASLLLLWAASSSVSAQDIFISTVVIDPGHGGKDPGCVSADGKTYEKTLTLDIAKRLSAKIREAYPEVKVILTREKDVFIPLNDRAEIANKANANLFISIHIDACDNKKARGASVYVLGDSKDSRKDRFRDNLNVCLKENSVVQLEDDYQTNYQGFDPNEPDSFIFMQLVQSAYLEQSISLSEMVVKHLGGGPVKPKPSRAVDQACLLVLWRTAMPSILCELGYMSNASDLALLREADNRDKLAGSLFDAFCQYKTDNDSSFDLTNGPSESPASVAAEVPASGKPASTGPVTAAAGDAGSKEGAQARAGEAAALTLYGTQIMAGKVKMNPKDKAFMGYTPEIVDAGGIYKYVIGVSRDLGKAKEMSAVIKKKYKDAFLVRIEGNHTFPVR